MTTPNAAQADVRLTPEAIHDLVVRIFTRLGSPAGDAAALADVIVWSHLTGRDGHGPRAHSLVCGDGALGRDESRGSSHHRARTSRHPASGRGQGLRAGGHDAGDRSRHCPRPHAGRLLRHGEAHHPYGGHRLFRPARGGSGMRRHRHLLGQAAHGLSWQHGAELATSPIAMAVAGGAGVRCCWTWPPASPPSATAPACGARCGDFPMAGR